MTLRPPIQTLGRLLRGSKQAFESPCLDLVRRRRRCQVVVQFAGRSFRDMRVGHATDQNPLFPATGPGDDELVTDANVTMRLGDDAVDDDPTDLAFTLGFRARLEEAGDIEPDIETDSLQFQPVRLPVQARCCTCNRVGCGLPKGILTCDETDEALFIESARRSRTRCGARDAPRGRVYP